MSYDFLAKAMEDASLRRERQPPVYFRPHINRLVGDNCTIISRYDPSLVKGLKFKTWLTPDEAMVMPLRGSIFVHTSRPEMALVMKVMQESDRHLFLFHETQWTWITALCPPDTDIMVVPGKYPFLVFDESHKHRRLARRRELWPSLWVYRDQFDGGNRPHPLEGVPTVTRFRVYE